MLDLGFFEKIRKLKERFAHESPIALQQIEEWEVRLKELSLLDDYSNLSTTKAVVAQVRERLKVVMLRRAAGKGLTSEEFKQLDAREEELRFFLTRLMPPFAEEIAEIERLIDSELAP